MTEKTVPAAERPGGNFPYAVWSAAKLACRFEYFTDVAGNFHASPFFYQFSVFVDQKGAAFNTASDFSVTGFRFHDVEPVAQSFVRVGNQREGQIEFFGEVFVRTDAVPTDADDFSV